MTIASASFLFAFLPITLILYTLLRDIKKKNSFLLLASIFFYGFSGLGFAFILTSLVFINYIAGLLVAKTESKKRTRLFLIFALMVDFGILFFYKYFDFTIFNINNLFNLNIPLQESIMMPVGLSFAVFKLATYIIDLYRGKISCQKNFGLLLLYTMLFSTVVSGPIVQYCDIANQFKERKVGINDIYEGFRRFTSGFVKKILVANILGEVADKAFAGEAAFSCAVAWLGILCYSLQLYFDFSGYSDMALGISRMLGFHFKENFNYPYISKSIQEFWRRWHISLSTWFREYLYIPLGGNRKGTLRTYLNLLVVFIITGLWHGANWTFVFWGLFHGLFMVLERSFLGKFLQKAPAFLQHFYALFVIVIGWVYFRADSISEANQYVSYLFSFSSMKPARLLFLVDKQILSIFVIALIFSTPIYPWAKEKLTNCHFSKRIITTDTLSLINDFLLILLFIAAIGNFVGTNSYPFLYGRF